MQDKQIVTFYIGEDLFGIDILFVREINRNFEITSVDRAPSFVKGLMNLRGQIVTVLDLSIRLNLQPSPDTKKACIILKTKQDFESIQGDYSTQKLSEDLVGFLVDRIGDVLFLPPESLDYLPKDADITASKFIEAVVQLKDQLLVILDISKLIAYESQIIRK